MRQLVSKVTRRAFSSAGYPCRNGPSSSVVTKHFRTIAALQRKSENTRKISIPSNFSIGFYRALSFATGFSPLKAKPLESILDVDRAKNKSPEELADIWDDVCFFTLLLLLCLHSLMPLFSISTHIFTLLL